MSEFIADKQDIGAGDFVDASSSESFLKTLSQASRAEKDQRALLATLSPVSGETKEK